MDNQDMEGQEHQDPQEEEFIDDQDALEVLPESADEESVHNMLEADMDDLEVIEDVGIDEGVEDTELPVEDSITCFTKHTGSVFSVTVQPSGELACSGGEDDKAFVWSVSDGSVSFECGGHKDSVTCTGFSHDGKYVATADMGGLVQVWVVPTGEQVWSFETDEIEWLRWHPQAHVLLVGTSSGEGWMWKVPTGDCKTFQGHNSRNTCAALLGSGRTACFGYEDGTIKVLDLKEGSTLINVTGAMAHTGTVTCLAVHRDNALLLSGSEDSTAKLTNINSGRVLATFQAGFPTTVASGSPPQASEENEEDENRELVCVEAVGFSSVLPVAVTGSLSGVLGVWDLPTQQLRLQCPHDAGIVSVHCSQQSPTTYTGCLDGVLRRWDLRTGQCVREWQGHLDQILDTSLTSDEAFLLAAGNDKTVRTFNTSL